MAHRRGRDDISEDEYDPVHSGDEGYVAPMPREPSRINTVTGEDDGDAEWEACDVEKIWGEEECGTCILCIYDGEREGVETGVRDILMRLERELKTNTTAGMEQRVLSTQKYYNEHLRDILVTDGCPEWTLESIRGHMSGAHGNGQVNVLRSRHEAYMGPLLEAIRMDLVQRSTRDAKRLRVNYKGVDMYRKLSSQLYMMDKKD